MSARSWLVMAALGVAAATPVHAADLPRGGSIGEIFAPAPVYKTPRYVTRENDYVVAPWVNNSPRVPGYYGRAGDFYYSSYYGTSPFLIWGRLPYACKFYASC